MGRIARVCRQICLAAVAVAALVLGSHFIQQSAAQITSGQRITPLGYQQITLTGTAQTLTVPAGAAGAYFYVETAAARYRDDGTAPTTSSGMPIPINGTLFYSGNLSGIQFIAQTGSPVLNVLYYRFAG